MNDTPAKSLPRQSKVTTRLTIAGLLLLVLTPILYLGLRGEMDRWRAARAMESWLDGNKQESIRTLQTITERLPHDHRLKLVLGEWLLEDYQAEQALKLAEAIPEQYRDRRSQRLIQHCLLALGQPEEALAAYRQANPANEVPAWQEVYHKNALSYFQALANQELDLARTNSNSVVGEIAHFWNSQQHIPLSAHMQGLFCTAVIYRQQMQRFEADADRRDQYAEQATTILSGAIEHLEQEYSIKCQQERFPMKKFFPVWFWEPEDEKNDDAAHALATLLTLRALIYQDLEQDELSHADRRQAMKLGYEPEEMADMMPSFADCVYQLELVSMVLDTRGCVNYQLNDFSWAQADLNIAVMGQEALVDVAEFTPRNRLETSLDPRQQFEQFVRAPRRTLAALLFHRSWARRGVGDELGARQDVAKIRELGYVPGNYLF